MHGRRRGALAIGAMVLVAACSKTPEPEPAAAPPRASAAAAPKPLGSSAAPSGPTDLTWDAPKAWTKVENPSPMRKATYQIPKVAGDSEDAEMSVSQAGGSVEMNVKRWTGQFEKTKDDATKRLEKQVGDLKVTVVEIHGTFTGSGMPGAPAATKPDYAMLAAIVETSGSPHFFKLTGPEKTVMSAKVDFDKMVESFRGK